MERRRTAVVFASGALTGAALCGLIALLLGECEERADEVAASGDDDAGGVDRDDTAGGAPALPRELSDRGVGGSCVYSGTVTDAGGRPAAGALVGVRALDAPWGEADLSAEARADAKGAFALPGLDGAIPYQVFAFAPGMAVADVERPECGARIDFVLEPGARLIVEARAGGGDPPGPVEVQLAGGPVWPPRVGTTDGSGRLEIDGLPPGDYAVWAGGHGLAGLTGEPVGLEAGDERTVELALEPARVAEVEVEDESGAPVPGATVFARPRTAPLLVLVGETDARGAARLAGLAAAEHDVEALAPGYLRGDPSSAIAGAPTAIRLRRGARVTGRVVRSDDAPVAGARLEVEEELGLARVAWAGGGQREILGRLVSAQRGGLPPVRPAEAGTIAGPALIPLPAGSDGPGAAPVDDSWLTDEEGRFSLAGLPPGGVMIGAFHPDCVMREPARLTLEPGGAVDGVRIEMRPGALLRVRTLGESGLPLDGVDVRAFGDGDEILASAATDRDGTAELRGLPASARVEASAEGRVPAVARVSVRLGRTSEIELTLPRADLVLRGRLTDPRGFGIGQAIVTARSMTRGSAHVLQGTSEPDGTFALEGAGPGDYHVTAEIGGRPAAQFPGARAGQDVKLVADGSGVAAAPGDEPGLVTPDMVAQAQGQDVPLLEPGEGDEGGEEDLGVIAVTETLEEGVHSGDYGYVDQLPVTGPVPGKGGLPVEIGGAPGNVIVKSVAPGSRVAGAGLRAGDRIVSVDGRKVQTAAQAKAAIGGPIGSVVVIEVVHAGESVSIVVQRVRVR